VAAAFHNRTATKAQDTRLNRLVIICIVEGTSFEAALFGGSIFACFFRAVSCDFVDRVFAQDKTIHETARKLTNSRRTSTIHSSSENCS
jgi:hypothetical protein